MARRREWSAPGLPWIVDLMRDHALSSATAANRGGDLDEARRQMTMVHIIDRAELFWVTPKMTDLAVQSAPTLPDWTPTAAMPADSGIVVWDRPVGTVDDLVGRPYQVSGAIWEVRGGALLIGLLTRHATPPLVPMRTIEVQQPAEIRPADHADADVEEVLRAIASTWLLMGQPRIADTVIEPSPGESRRAATAGQPWTMPEVQVVELRATRPQPREDSPTPEAREFHYRWWVRGHWRQQACGPGRSQRRPVWIDPHIKGPDEAPLADVPTVHVLRK